MTRLRDLGISIGSLEPGRCNSITDVDGVRVGHATIVEGSGKLVVGKGPVRTGVTVIVPRDGWVRERPLFAGEFTFNGAGDFIGLEWIRESGLLTTPIALTNTHSVGVVRDALVAWDVEEAKGRARFFSMPAVTETSDALMNDMNGQHVTADHVRQALASAAGGPVPEGNVGGGTGMTCHGFKGGIGTSSRVLPEQDGGWTVGVLVQANYGRRDELRVAGVPVGIRIPTSEIPEPKPPLQQRKDGSIIVVVATDAPLLPDQCRRLARRGSVGLARVGGGTSDTSGDMMLAFATGNDDIPSEDYGGPAPLVHDAHAVPHQRLSALFEATADATEEAIVNALLAAETMIGRDDIVAYGLDPDRLLRAMRA